MEKTLCELFAGVGGFRLGIERADATWKTVWFSQWEPSMKRQYAHACYVQHYGDIDSNTNRDITTVEKTEIPKHTLLVGGFPCQDYSVASTQSKGIEGKKGVLWWEIYKILQEHGTNFVLLENVDRLLKSPAKQRGRDFGIMLSCFNELGYDVEWRVINAAEYGWVQRRKRIFIFAYKRESAYGKQRRKENAEQIISNTGMFAIEFPIKKLTNEIQQSKIGEKPIQEISDTYTNKFENAGYMTDGVINTVAVEAEVETIMSMQAILESNVSADYYIDDTLNEKYKYLKGSKRVKRVNKAGYEYIYSEGSMAYPDDIMNPARTMLTSEGSLNRCTHIIEDPETHRLRTLTPIETERLQGFDDGWTAGMPEGKRYFCMGNALVVPMVTRMAKYITKVVENEK
jgi:DNA (cytosine-5)-methyltransferase 1